VRRSPRATFNGVLSIVRCPACGKATVAVGTRKSPVSCSRCGAPMPSEESLARADSETLEHKVREQLYGPHGLSRPRGPTP